MSDGDMMTLVDLVIDTAFASSEIEYKLNNGNDAICPV